MKITDDNNYTLKCMVPVQTEKEMIFMEGTLKRKK
jgi:hypothetical protein